MSKIAFVFLVALIGFSQIVHGTDGLFPNVSIVDYLKSLGEPNDYSTRKTRFEAKYKGETYKGSEEQNTRWLADLVAENKKAVEIAERAAASASELSVKNLSDEKTVTSKFACPAWVPAEGFGVNGSYGYNIRVKIIDGKIEDRNLMVTLSSGLSNLGSVSTGGKVEVLIEGETKPLAEIRLMDAWFATIGSPGSVTMFGEKGTSIVLPQGKKVSLRVSIYPAVKTTTGSVALWPCTRTIVLP